LQDIINLTTKTNEYFELVASLSIPYDETKKEIPTFSGENSCIVAHSNDFPNEVTKRIEVNPEDIWDILEENRQLANLKDLIEPLEERRLREEQEHTQRDHSQVVQ
jgi:hypothetical protein